MIETRDLWFSYGEREVLKGVNFKAKRGEVTIIMGRNGAGKTTLLLHLNGLLKPKKGEVMLDGIKVNYDKRSIFELRKKVAIVFQNPEDQIIAPTVWEEVAFGPANAGLSLENVEKALKLVGLEGYERRLCSQLSGGEKKKLSVADAIAMHSDFLILDEPTSGLDQPGFEAIVELVLKLKGLGKGIIIATHDFELAERVGDRFYYLEGGEIVYEGEKLNYEIAKKIGIRCYARTLLISNSEISAEIAVKLNGSQSELLKVIAEAILKACEGKRIALQLSDEALKKLKEVAGGER